MLLLLLLVWRLGADDRVAERAGSGGDVGKATKEVPFRNSLGMEFVPVNGAAGVLWGALGRWWDCLWVGGGNPVVSRSTSGYRLAPLGGVREFLIEAN